jgi:hypothetical protein
MMSIGEQRALLNLVTDEQRREPQWAKLWTNIVNVLKNDIKKHEQAIEDSTRRNAAKRSRKDQRGPYLG